jgi:hypothetical protein
MQIIIKNLTTKPKIPTLSTSNAVTVNWCFGDIPLMTERGDYAPAQAMMMKPMYQTSRSLKNLAQRLWYRNRAAPPCTHTRTVIKTTPGIFVPAEIAEVDSFGQYLETPQHDDVQRWCSLAHVQPFGRPRGRDERWRWRGWRTREKGELQALGNSVLPLSLGPLYIVGTVW